MACETDFGCREGFSWQALEGFLDGFSAFGLLFESSGMDYLFFEDVINEMLTFGTSWRSLWDGFWCILRRFNSVSVSRSVFRFFCEVEQGQELFGRLGEASQALLLSVLVVLGGRICQHCL